MPDVLASKLKLMAESVERKGCGGVVDLFLEFDKEYLAIEAPNRPWNAQRNVQKILGLNSRSSREGSRGMRG